MAKPHGSTRLVKPYPLSEKTVRQLFMDSMIKENGNPAESYYSRKSNAFLISVIGRKEDENERLAAKYMVKNGISVILTSEEAIAQATAILPDGTPKFSDGKFSVYTFEQKTIDKTATNALNSFKKGIAHAVEKRADIAVIFDRYGIGHREQVERAMLEYKPPAWGKLPKAVVVISNEGKVYEHHF